MKARTRELIEACSNDRQCVEFCKAWWKHGRGDGHAPNPADFAIHPALADVLRRQCNEVLKQKAAR